MVAGTHQRIAYRTINASQCDIGIYVGAGITNVTINGVKVSGAKFQGIFAEKTSHLTIENSRVFNNGWHTIDPAAPPLPSGVHSYVGQSFAISVFGVSHATLSGNVVFDNGRGGIGVMDNGANDPGSINQHPNAHPVASTHVSVVGNRMWGNDNGCGLVAATQNFGGSLSDLRLTGNKIVGTGASSRGVDVGGLVVAADLPYSSVNHVSVQGNTVTGSVEGGVVVNAEAFSSWTNDVSVRSNTLSGNNWGHQEAPQTAGVIVFENPGWNTNPLPPGAKAPVNKHTVIERNTITEQFYGIWATGHQAPTISKNHIRVTPGGSQIVIL